MMTFPIKKRIKGRAEGKRGDGGGVSGGDFQELNGPGSISYPNLTSHSRTSPAWLIMDGGGDGMIRWRG